MAGRTDKLVDNDIEVAKLQFVYGLHGARSGMRMEPNNDGTILGEMINPLCRIDNGFADDVVLTAEQERKCGPFKMDFYTAPLWYKFRDESNTDLPPR